MYPTVFSAASWGTDTYDISLMQLSSKCIFDQKCMMQQLLQVAFACQDFYPSSLSPMPGFQAGQMPICSTQHPNVAPRPAMHCASWQMLTHQHQQQQANAAWASETLKAFHPVAVAVPISLPVQPPQLYSRPLQSLSQPSVPAQSALLRSHQSQSLSEPSAAGQPAPSSHQTPQALVAKANKAPVQFKLSSQPRNVLPSAQRHSLELSQVFGQTKPWHSSTASLSSLTKAGKTQQPRVHANKHSSLPEAASTAVQLQKTLLQPGDLSLQHRHSQAAAHALAQQAAGSDQCAFQTTTQPTAVSAPTAARQGVQAKSSDVPAQPNAMSNSTSTASATAPADGSRLAAPAQAAAADLSNQSKPLLHNVAREQVSSGLM